MEHNLELARRLNDLVTPVAKACWRNSLEAMLAYRMTGGDMDGVYYIEGWTRICDGAIAIEHGWLEVDGRIVDVTLLGENEAMHYHPVFRYTMDQVGENVDRYRILPFYPQTREGAWAMNRAWFLLPGHEGIREKLTYLIEQREQDHA